MLSLQTWTDRRLLLLNKEISISYRAIKALSPLKSRRQPPQPTSGVAAILTTNNKGLCSPGVRGDLLSNMEVGVLPRQQPPHPTSGVAAILTTNNKGLWALVEGEVGSPTWRLGYFQDSSHPIQPQVLLPSWPRTIKACEPWWKGRLALQHGGWGTSKTAATPSNLRSCCLHPYHQQQKLVQPWWKGRLALQHGGWGTSKTADPPPPPPLPPPFPQPTSGVAASIPTTYNKGLCSPGGRVDLLSNIEFEVLPRQHPPHPTSGLPASILATNNKGLCSPGGKGKWLPMMGAELLPLKSK